MNENLNNPLDQATSARLARLRSMPVDTTGLAARLRESIPELREQKARTSIIRLWISPLRLAAAILVVLTAVLAVILAGSGSVAVASVDQLAALHEETLADKDHAVHVDSIAAANVALSKEWPKTPEVPQVGQDAVMSCCVHEIARKKMACVMLNVDGQPVTMAVAKTSEIKCPMGTMSTRNGVMYCSHSVRGVNMVMVEKGGQWTCYMGKVPVERLADLATAPAK
jgi:hypothetical protein